MLADSLFLTQTIPSKGFGQLGGSGPVCRYRRKGGQASVYSGMELGV